MLVNTLSCQWTYSASLRERTVIVTKTARMYAADVYSDSNGSLSFFFLAEKLINL